MIFKNGRLIFSTGVRDGLEIIESGGRICGIREAGIYPDGDGLDLHGNYLAPGFVDLHVHGAVGHDTMEGTREAFRVICDFHASGGTTSLLLTTATAPIAEIVRVLRAAEACATELPRVAGVHVEGPFISPERAGAQGRQWISEPDAASLEALLEVAPTIKRLTLAPELCGAVDAMDRLRAHNIIISGGHSDAWEEEARIALEHGMRSVTHTYNCMSSAERRGAHRVAGLLEFAMTEPEITCELIADGHHVSTTLMKLLYRAKGAAGICLATDATAGAGLPAGAQFRLAGADCIVADGVCWLTNRSALAGSSSRMIDLVRVMVEQVGAPLHEAVLMATANPARMLGQSEWKGTLEIGTDADFVVFSPQLEVVQTFAGGEQIFGATNV
jgi:N-acetylglucosamine-6-phosphate deacetylase